VVPGRRSVDVTYSPERDRARYRNLVYCCRIWHCPICAHIITEKRRRELTGALDDWPGTLALGTFTVQHSRADNLAGMLAALSYTRRKMRKGRQWARLVDEFGIVGTVRALEVTFGDHGWHPHDHVLFVFEGELDGAAINALQSACSGLWLKFLGARGYSASAQHGVVVRASGDVLTEYVTKFGDAVTRPATTWSVAHEIAKQPVKQGRLAGRTPFALLGDYLYGDSAAGRLFVEYAYAFKGQRQLHWSHGLRDRLGLGREPDDTELVEEPDELERLLVSLTLEQWRVIESRELRGHVLDQARKAARSGDLAGFVAYLESIGAGLPAE